MTDENQGELATIDPETVAILPGNPNHMEADDFGRLCGSIDKLGFLQPLLVRPVTDEDVEMFDEVTQGHEYIVTDGEHRLRAALHVGLREVSALIKTQGPDTAAVAQISLNKLRGQLDITKTGHALDELVKAGWSMEELEITGYATDEMARLLDAIREDPLDDLLSDPVTPPEMEAGPKKYPITVQCGNEALRAKIRGALFELAGEDGTILEGLLAALELD